MLNGFPADFHGHAMVAVPNHAIKFRQPVFFGDNLIADIHHHCLEKCRRDIPIGDELARRFLRGFPVLCCLDCFALRRWLPVASLYCANCQRRCAARMVEQGLQRIIKLHKRDGSAGHFERGGIFANP